MKTGLRCILFAAGIVVSILLITAYRSDNNPDFQYTLKSDDIEFFLNAEKKSYPFKTHLNKIAAGVCSHHLLMAEYISGFFKELSIVCGNDGIKTFIIIGPNHYARGRAVVAASSQRWKTPFGFIEPDCKIAGELVKNGFAEYDQDAFTFEHSMGALIPFIKEYFPQSKVVPVIIKHGFSENDAYRLGEFLSENSDESTFVLLSADFVHNKYSREIEPFDRHTADVIERYKTYMDEGVLPLLNMDCNRGLEVLMSYSRGKNYTADILLNTNSAVVSKKNVKATSYFFIYMGKL